MGFSFQQRQQAIENFKSEYYDLVVVGGGISGAGVARDAASRGMKVALVEASDFSSGTSSRSSKLIHGGIRYLENLEFGLVFEALSERSLLFEIAPHLVHPLRFMLPMFDDARVSMFEMGMGMMLYDVLAMFDAPELHESLNKDEALRRMSILKQVGLKGAYEYSDAYMDDDRLTLETLRSAQGLGADIVNYASAEGAEFLDEKISAITCVDRHSNEEFVIRGHHFVSTVGPWTDQLAHKFFDNWQDCLRPSKGIHLTLSKERLPLESAVVMATAGDDRIVFGIPRHEMVIIGTTDTDFKEDPSEVHTTKEDVDYLLKIVNEYYPNANIKEADIIASYAGVRPLVNDGSSTESKTSREHVIIRDDRNLTFLSGGKYTTYRHMAEETVDATLSSFSLEQLGRFGRSRTKTPLNPKSTKDLNFKALQELKDRAEAISMEPDLLLQFIERHGYEAFSILDKYKNCFELIKKNQWLIEAQLMIDETMCLHVLDFYLRRSPLFLAFKDHGLSLLDSITQVFADHYDWSSSKIENEKAKVYEYIKFELSWKSN